VHNLLVTGHDRAQREFFDLILVDEATQMEVALAILALISLAEGGSVVLAGDPKQLPPILQAEPPLGLEPMVGSIYRFCEDLHQVEPVMLEVNYPVQRHAGQVLAGSWVPPRPEQPLHGPAAEPHHAPTELPAGELAAHPLLDARVVVPAGSRLPGRLLRLPRGTKQPVEPVRGGRRRGARDPAV
jgi:AAA domain